MLIPILIALAWWGTGICGFIYWWTSESALNPSDLVFACFVSLAMGPVTWIVGYTIHDRSSKIIIPMRKRNHAND